MVQLILARQRGTTINKIYIYIYIVCNYHHKKIQKKYKKMKDVKFISWCDLTEARKQKKIFQNIGII